MGCDADDILIKTAEIIIKRFQEDEEKDGKFSTIDFIREVTGEHYKLSRGNDGRYNINWGEFLSANRNELNIKSVGRSRKPKTSTEVWKVLN